MPFRKQDTVDNFLFPGRPVATRIGSIVLSRVGLAVDTLVVGRGTRWVELLGELPDEVRSKHQLVDQGPDFASKVIGLASTGLRVAAFSTAEDASTFMRLIARRPFPVAAVVHALGNVDSGSYGYGFHLSATTPQESVDFALIAQRASEATVVPGLCLHRGQ